jgi:hypothetical protein
MLRDTNPETEIHGTETMAHEETDRTMVKPLVGSGVHGWAR